MIRILVINLFSFFVITSSLNAKELEKNSVNQSIWREIGEHLIDHEAVHKIITEYIIENAPDFLSGETFLIQLPSEGTEAHINMSDVDGEFIEVELQSDWGNGWANYEVDFTCNASFWTAVSKWDAYDDDVEWLSISYGDPEEDHYFEAEGETELLVNAVVSVKFILDKELLDELEHLSDTPEELVVESIEIVNCMIEMPDKEGSL